ncbi:unnamed protein product [Amaranthus hypochondriacus]
MDHSCPEVGSFTRMLYDEQFSIDNLSEFSSWPPSLHIGASGGNHVSRTFDSLVSDIDLFGYNDLGFATDEDEDDDAREANDNILKKNAPSQVFNKVHEVEPMLMDT